MNDGYLVISENRKSENQKEIAERFGLNYNTVRSIIFNSQRNSDGEKSRGHRKKKLDIQHIEFIKKELDKDCLKTREELADLVKEKFDVEVCPSTVGNYLHDSVTSVMKVKTTRERLI